MSRRYAFWKTRPKSEVQIQFMSDLHLEVQKLYTSFIIPPVAPFLLLAGDIGRLEDFELYLEFLKVQCVAFTKVFLILGNHEFYGTSLAEGRKLAAKLESHPSLQGKLQVLDRQRVNLSSSVILLGCSLWSRLRPENEEAIQRSLQDFKRIHQWTAEAYREEHKIDVAWLRSEICNIRAEEKNAGIPQRRIVVATHHAPIREGTSRQPENYLTDAFATDLVGADEIFSEVVSWIFGHTHFTTRLKVFGVDIVSNQRGYFSGQNEQTGSSTTSPQWWRLGSKYLSVNRPKTKDEDKEFDLEKSIHV